VKKELQQKVEEILQSPGEEKLGKGSIEEEWLELKNSLWKHLRKSLVLKPKFPKGNGLMLTVRKLFG
jgi:hypothetical protein